MRAMRTFVSGLHRLPDDPTLAYTLMVSAVESLAQDFDAYIPAWEDLEAHRRADIDKALSAADGSVQSMTREAILKHEHLSLKRRYREFTLARVSADYFREAPDGWQPIARWELEPALRQAYDLRSAYIHQLRELPDILLMPLGKSESCNVDRRPALTFLGLYRLTRHVIKAFVAERPKVTKEVYHYQLEEAGIVSLPLVPQYWIWRPMTESSQALRRLEGLLEIAANQLLRQPDALYPDMRAVLAEVEKLLGQAPHTDRPALLGLHALYNLRIADEYRTPGLDTFLERHGEEAARPGPHSITVALVLGATDDWPLDVHQKALDDYFLQRPRPKGLHAPRMIEAAMCLDLAEKYRLADALDDARAAITLAVDAHPANGELRALEAAFDPTTEIVWWKVLLPSADQAEVANSAGEGDIRPIPS